MSSMQKNLIEKIVSSRPVLSQSGVQKKQAEEGGCGVTGFISSIPIKGRHIYEPSIQMHNRGNGKGGGIAAVGLCAQDLGSARRYWTATTCCRWRCWTPGATGPWRKATSILF